MFSTYAITFANFSLKMRYLKIAELEAVNSSPWLFLRLGQAGSPPKVSTDSELAQMYLLTKITECTVCICNNQVSRNFEFISDKDKFVSVNINILPAVRLTTKYARVQPTYLCIQH